MSTKNSISIKTKNSLEEANILNFFIISAIENQKGETVIVKKELPPIFLKLCGLDPNIGSIWFAPSGYQKKGETREEAAQRITLEETGYFVKPLYQISDTLALLHDDEYPSLFKIVVYCSLESKDQDKNWQKPELIKEIKWIKKQEIFNYVLPEIISKWPEGLRKLYT